MDIRETFLLKQWEQYTTPLEPSDKEHAGELLELAKQRKLLEDARQEGGEDDCIIVWPSRGLVGKTSVFRMLYDAGHRLEMSENMLANSERLIREAGEKMKFDA